MSEAETVAYYWPLGRVSRAERTSRRVAWFRKHGRLYGETFDRWETRGLTAAIAKALDLPEPPPPAEPARVHSPEQIRQVFWEFEAEAMTLEAIGKVFGRQRERIRQIEAEALRKLRRPQIAQFLLEYTAAEPDLKVMTPPPALAIRPTWHCGGYARWAGDVLYCPRCGNPLLEPGEDEDSLE